MDKKNLSERDICTKFITPALRQAGWDEMHQIREEVSFTKGRIIVRGKLVSRGKGKRADYILYYKPNIPIALIEAKDNTHGIGEGVKTRLKEHLMEECNLHTIVRLPNSVFRPYASIGTNLLFFEKGEPTKDIWFYEHLVPEGQKAYSMTKPIRLEHLQGCIDWWGGAKREGREETDRAWKVTADEITARGFNLDIKNPHTEDANHGDPEELLAGLTAAEAETTSLRDQLKAILAEALTR